LSQGQRSRIGLARLALSRRPLWILDEPATALDTAGLALLAALLGKHLADGGIAIAATHHPLDLPAAVIGTLALG
jgi:heme exporter protein A